MAYIMDTNEEERVKVSSVYCDVIYLIQLA